MELRNLDGEAQAFAQARLANVRTVRAFANEAIETKRFQQVPKWDSTICKMV